MGKASQVPSDSTPESPISLGALRKNMASSAPTVPWQVLWASFLMRSDKHNCWGDIQLRAQAAQCGWRVSQAVKGAPGHSHATGNLLFNISFALAWMKANLGPGQRGSPKERKEGASSQREPFTEPGHRRLSGTLHWALPHMQERKLKHLDAKDPTHVRESILVSKVFKAKDKIKTALQPMAPSQKSYSFKSGTFF